MLTSTITEQNLQANFSLVLFVVLMFYPVRCPGPAYDLSFSEVRGHSLVVLWKAPVYTGAGAVTGYLVDMAKKGSSEFVTLNQEAVSHRYLQVREVIHRSGLDSKLFR